MQGTVRLKHTTAAAVAAPSKCLVAVSNYCRVSLLAERFMGKSSI